MFELRLTLPEDLEAASASLRREWRASGKIGRLWDRDPSLWTGSGEEDWLGWLEAPSPAASELSSWLEFGREARDSRISDVLLLGMGGSSLCADVLGRTFERQQGFPAIHILDSTVPAQIRAMEERLDLARTLVIVASKSGSTLEPRALSQYFWSRLETLHGTRNGSHFVAITDPGSELEETALSHSFRRIFLGAPSIGGRFSALSPFGMVPAAAAGIDVSRLLSGARDMAELCRIDAGDRLNPGVDLGLILGAAAVAGRDKLTLLTSPTLSSFGAWLEQLVAESTGKQGKVILPVDLEPPTSVERYGDDRVFVSIGLAEDDPAVDATMADSLIAAGHPLISIELSDRHDLGAEFFRWEIATAVAGAILEVNPFDQPDVEASKIATRELTRAYEETGGLPAVDPMATLDDLELYADPIYIDRLGGPGVGLESLLQDHLQQTEPGDYFAILAFLEMNESHQELLQAMRGDILQRRRVATCLGFGPRYLHSTGQAHKGGPNTGVFLQITADGPGDVPVPGSGYSFGTIQAAQAGGDFAVLLERERRALRIHIRGEPQSGLRNLARLLT